MKQRSEKVGFKVIPTGIEHGTVTVLVDGASFEVTTLREDIETDGRRAVVRFGRDFGADARRRDFTINALSVDLGGRVHDYVGGLADLAAKRVRFIGDPATRIREDYLRILRFFRFHAEYAEGAPDEAGLEAAVRERAGLSTLSHERIRSELLKLLSTRRAAEVVGVLHDRGLLTFLLGGVVEMGRLSAVIAYKAAGLDGPDPLHRLAALAVMIEEDAERLRERLRLSNEEHRRLARYAALVAVLKAWPQGLDAVAIRRLAAEHGVSPLADALAAIAGEPRPELVDGWLGALLRFRFGEEPIPVFPLRGADFLEAGVPKGPRIGVLLAQARQAWLEAGCPMDEKATAGLLARALADAATP